MSIDFNTKYTQKQRDLFKPILDAYDVGNEGEGDRLAKLLSPEDSVAFDNYIQDLEDFRIWQEKQQAEIASLQQKIDTGNARLEVLGEKRNEVVHNYGNQIARNNGVRTQATTNTPPSQNQNSSKKRNGGNCTIF